MQFDQVVFLVNSLSRSGRRTSEAIESYMEGKDMAYRIIKAEGSAFDLKVFMAENPENTLYIIAGGDGSLNYYVSYLEEHGLEIPIAYLATGSGNDFARSLNIPHNDLNEGLDHIFNKASLQELSIIKASDVTGTYYAVNSLGFGIDGWVNKKIEDSSDVMKRMLGSNIYTALLVPSFFDMTPRHTQVIIDDKVHDFYKTTIVVVLNNSYLGGGIELFPGANAKDDDLRIVVIDNLKISDVPDILKRLLSDQSHFENEKIQTFTVKRLHLNILEEEYGQKDGEVIDKGIYSFEIEAIKRLFWI